ncbi:hypothetical protein PoB_006696600 [Plakobranchus ocellatus]|uniref:Uncharacterized protein n=1 Tax=Plakobranchus ocellatus TaxID=259542 RepID=A0AAV4D8T5_9GAST|nr:hypothetical protein PoB_006696600 [Plakobranchus ocellatus]
MFSPAESQRQTTWTSERNFVIMVRGYKTTNLPAKQNLNEKKKCHTRSCALLKAMWFGLYTSLFSIRKYINIDAVVLCYGKQRKNNNNNNKCLASSCALVEAMWFELYSSEDVAFTQKAFDLCQRVAGLLDTENFPLTSSELK